METRRKLLPAFLIILSAFMFTNCPVPGGSTGRETKVSIDPSWLIINMDDSAALNAMVSSGTGNQEVGWSSNDEDIVIVDSTGSIYGIRPGVAVVTAYLVAEPTKSADCTVTVLEKELFRNELLSSGLDDIEEKWYYFNASLHIWG